MFASFITGLVNILWSTPLPYLCLGAGVVFTIVLKGVQVRKIPTQLKLLFNGKSSDRGLSSFQAFCLAIAGRVGTGNIAGVATAICFGGPGAVFWMWVMALLGASTSFVECTMAQLYKEDRGGEYRGGVAYYLARGLNFKPIGVIYAVVMIVAEFALVGIQSNAIAASFTGAWGTPKVGTGIFLAVLIALIIFGGVKRIGAVADKVVPFMAIAYCIVSLVVLFANITAFPATIALICKSAFGGGQIAGGMGCAIVVGYASFLMQNRTLAIAAMVMFLITGILMGMQSMMCIAIGAAVGGALTAINNSDIFITITLVWSLFYTVLLAAGVLLSRKKGAGK